MKLSNANALPPLHRPPSRPPRTHRRRRRHAALALACMAALGVSQQAQADAVTHWNEFAHATTTLPLPVKLRAMAMVQIAVHDALNSIRPRYASYTAMPAAPSSSAPEAAVATAAHDVLVALVPDSQKPAIDAEYAAYIAALPRCRARSRGCNSGIAAGRAAARAILDERIGDHSESTNWHRPYDAAPAAGVYQRTPGVADPVFGGWGGVTPFAMPEGDHFRAPPSPLQDLAGPVYAADYIQVKDTGSAVVRGGAPDSDESRIARFWYAGGLDWFAFTRQITRPYRFDLWQNARLYALLAIGQADVTISVFDSKYHHAFWRPVTAIQWMGGDGNPATLPDPSWQPYLGTPPYPDYPCGTPMLAGAGTEVLRQVLGRDRVAYQLTVAFPRPELPPEMITRSYGSLSEAADESAISRVYAGIHFRTGCEVGIGLGEKIGQLTVQNHLRPLRPRGRQVLHP